MKYHVVLTDECGDEFSVTLDASSEDDAYDTVSMDYPESCVVSICGGGGRLRYQDSEDYDLYEDDLSPRQKEMNDRLDMGRNEAGEWLGFM